MQKFSAQLLTSLVDSALSRNKRNKLETISKFQNFHRRHLYAILDGNGKPWLVSFRPDMTSEFAMKIVTLYRKTKEIENEP